MPIAIVFLIALPKPYMQEARTAGCRSSAEADRYFEKKQKREVEENGPKKENYNAGPSSQDSLSSLGTHSNKRSTSLANLSSLTDLGFAAHSAIELLSEPVSV